MHTSSFTKLKERTMSFRLSSTPSERRRGVDQDDDGYNQVKAPPPRDDVDDSFVEQFRSYSPISLTSEDDGAKPPSVPNRDNVPEELCRMVSFGSLELSETNATVRVLNDTDEDSSAHQEKSVCSSVETRHVSNMAHFSSSRTFKASNATKTSGTQVVEQADVGMSRNQRRANRLKGLFLVPTVTAIAGEQEPDLQHHTNVHGDGVGTVSETESKLEPGFPFADEIDVGATQIHNKDVKVTKNLLYPTTAVAAGAQELIVQQQTNEDGDLPSTAPETEYIFEPDVECPSMILPRGTESTIPAMDVESHGENLTEPGLRVSNAEESFSDEAVGQERKFFRTAVHKKWCLLAVFVMILLGVGITVGLMLAPPTVLVTTSSHNSSPTGTPTTVPINASSPTSIPTGSPSVPQCLNIYGILGPLSNGYQKGEPQSKAFDLMVNQINMGLIPETCHSEKQIKERYSLLVLFYATGGKSWLKKWDVGSLKHHCFWNTSSPYEFFNGITCDDSNQTTRLDLMRNGLNGTIPTEIGLLTRLEGLNFSHNAISGAVPSELLQISTLQAVDFGFNSLQGALPDISRGSSPALVRLILDNNKLDGSLTSTLGILNKMEVFSAKNNSLIGAIPTEVGLLTSLTTLDLMSNKLYGEIPSELGLLTNLTILDLLSNELSGEIPSELGLLEKLKILNLGDNYLTGNVPTQLASLSQLQTVHVEKNLLSGDMESFCTVENLKKFPFLGADCPDEIVCDCCTYCCNSTGACS